MKVTIEYESKQEAFEALRAEEYVRTVQEILEYLRRIDKYGIPNDWAEYDKEDLVGKIREEVLRITDDISVDIF